MKKALVPLLAFLLVVPQVAAAQSSIACLYMLLRVYHKETEHCGVKLSRDYENRYLRFRANMEKYIRANAKGDAEAMIAGIAKNEERALAGLKSCNSDDFKLAQQALDNLLAPSNEHIVVENLKIARDPQAGTCGS
jgi:hypothetical protein